MKVLEILAHAKKIKQLDDEFNEKLWVFLGFIAPTQYTNFCEYSFLSYYFDGIGELSLELTHDLYYFFYEIPDSWWAINNYDIYDEDDFKEYLKKEYKDL